jgi:hypothetical protein
MHLAFFAGNWRIASNRLQNYRFIKMGLLDDRLPKIGNDSNELSFQID